MEEQAATDHDPLPSGRSVPAAPGGELQCRFRGEIALQYDTFSDLLGGARWEEALERSVRPALSVGGEEARFPFDAYYSSPGQFLFRDDRRDPLERFWLKWNLFLGLSRRIEEIHQAHRRPLLNLQPASLRVMVAGPAESFLPVRWRFSVDPSNLHPADRFVPPGLPADIPAQLFVPPADSDPLYAAPPVRRREIEKAERATLLVRSTERVRDSQPEAVRGIVQAQLISDRLKESNSSPEDLFRINPSLTEKGAGPIRIWAKKRPSDERAILIEGVTETVSAAVWEAFEKARQKIFSDSEVVIYRSLHLPCDLYSLGMILFRTLLVNDCQEIDGVRQAVSAIAESLGPISLSLSEEEKPLWTRRLRFYFQKEGDLFSKGALLYRQPEREKGGDAIPDDLWTEALLAGFRLIRAWEEAPLDQGGGLIGPILSDAESLADRIKLALFGSTERNREILEVCDLVRKELTD